VALTILQPPATGKALKTRPAYKGMLRAKLPALCGIGALFRWLCVRLAVLAESLPRPGTAQFKRFYLWPGRKGGCCAMHVVLTACLSVFAAPLLGYSCVAFIAKSLRTALAIAAAVAMLCFDLQLYIGHC
jgi:hypothetical protein